MPGKLKNRTRRAITLNLTTRVAPIRKVYPRAELNKDGTVSVIDRRLVIPDSVTILGRGESRALPDATPSCSEVAAAIRRGAVEWIPEDADVEIDVA